MPGGLRNLRGAQEAYDADLSSLDDLDDDQVEYLGGLVGVEDPDTDGIDCDSDVETE